MTTITETYEIVAETQEEHTTNKDFILQRFIASDPLNYNWTVDDQNLTITLKRTDLAWVAPVS